MATLGLAILAKEVRPPDEALTLLLKARDELELARNNSIDNPQLKAGLAFCYDSLGELYGKSGQPVAQQDMPKSGTGLEPARTGGANAGQLPRDLPGVGARTSSTSPKQGRRAGNAEQALSGLAVEPMSRIRTSKPSFLETRNSSTKRPASWRIAGRG